MGVHGFFGLLSTSRFLSILAFVSVLSFAFGVPYKAFSEDFLGFKNSVVVRGDLQEASLRTRTIGAPFRDTVSIRPILVSGVIAGFGRVKASFTTQRVQPALRRSTQPPVLLQGTVSLAGGSYPVAAYSSGKSVELSFVGKKVRSRRVRPRMYSLNVPVAKNSGARARVSSAPVMNNGVTCGQDAEVVSSMHMDNHRRNIESTPSTKPVKIVTIATDADAEWYLKHGEQSEVVIAKFLNTAEILYDAQFNIRFRIVSQHHYREQSPYTATDVGGLLAQFVINPENPSNFGVSREGYRETISLNHLFTGKDLEGSVVGMAYIGVVCSAPALSYGVTQYFGDLLTPLILAHELGHNFGAYHDVSDSSGLMYPNISVPAPNHFSTNSIKEISNHLATNSKCLLNEFAPMFQPTPVSEDTQSSVEGGQSAPAPAPNYPDENNDSGGSSPLTVSLNKERTRIGNSTFVRVRGRVFSTLGALSVGTAVELLAEGVPVSQAITNSLGEFTFYIKVKTPEKRRVLAWVRVVKSGEESHRLTLKRAPRYSKRVRGRANSRPYDWPVVTLT
jgi:hypothetical protein